MRNPLVLLFSFVIFRGFAQEIVPPDTFHYYRPDSIKYILALDTVNERVFDSIDNPKAYLLTNKNYYSSYVKIAIKEKHGYKVFALSYTMESDRLKVERTELTGYGAPELIVRWHHYAGHSGWENSIHEHWGGVQIWDLDSTRVLMDFENYYSMITWWQEFEEDTTGTLDYEDRKLINSGGDNTCSNYQVSFQHKQVTIQEIADCPDQDDNNDYLVTDQTIYVYELTPTGLIRKKP